MCFSIAWIEGTFRVTEKELPEIGRIPPPLEKPDPLAGGRLRLRTLVMIRWIAVAGQTVTVLVVHFGFGFKVPLLLCLAVIVSSVVSNIVLYLRMPLRARLSHRDATILLGFDVVQLGLLLFLTGGLENPFAILILAPATVSATILPRGSTIALMGLVVLCITVLALFHTPLPWTAGEFRLPGTYALGTWTALAVASVFISTYVWSVADEARRMSDALAETQVRLGREKNLSALGGLAAAAAHELGSPLATIAVVAKELEREVPADSPIGEDVALLISQTERCREILAGLDQNSAFAGHHEFTRLPLSSMIARAGSPYETDDVELALIIEVTSSGAEPVAAETPELKYGLGNLIQNAIQFANARVEIRLYWDDRRVSVTISDDGPGFSNAILASLGEPYVSTRSSEGEHMGLGFFIAQTLLERAGASLSFGNRQGAVVVIQWPRDTFEKGINTDAPL